MIPISASTARECRPRHLAVVQAELCHDGLLRPRNDHQDNPPSVLPQRRSDPGHGCAGKRRKAPRGLALSRYFSRSS